MTLNYTLIRLSEYRGATCGILLLNDRPFLSTLELPYKENQKQISCIPTGIYELHRHISPRFGETFIVQDVPNRENILFHWGNTVKDTQGCIIVGAWFGTLGDLPAVINSRLSFQKFMNYNLGQDKAQLTIR